MRTMKSDSNSRKRRMDSSVRPAIRLAAGAGALSLVAIGLGAGAGIGAANPGLGGEAIGAALAQTSTATKPASADQAQVVVGKAIAVTADAAGKLLSQGLYTSTTVTGSAAEQVKIPIGTSRPVELNGFTSLKTDGDSIVYDLKNSPGEVQTLIASGGQFSGKPLVEIGVDLKVDGKSVDPNKATSITGNVELTYSFTNNTNQVQAITYKDTRGKVRVKNANVAIPFTISYDATFGNGWAQLEAPWANSGFAAGQDITGSVPMGPNPLNGGAPNGKIVVKGVAENAALPDTTIKVVPTDSSGMTSTMGAVASGTSKLDNLLADKALPLLIEVQDGIGKAAGTVDVLLKEKVDPILNLLSKLRLDPKKANSMIEKGGKGIAGLGDALIGINSATEEVTARLASAGAQLTSAQSQAALAALIEDLDDLDAGLVQALPLLAQVADGLDTAAWVLGKEIPSAFAGLICPGGKSCTVGEIVDAYMLEKLPTTCTTGQGVIDAWNAAGVADAFDQAVTAASGSDKSNLQTLKGLLQTQAANGIPAGCEAAGTAEMNILEGLLANLGVVSSSLNDLTPLLKTISGDLDDISVGLKNLLAAMPTISDRLDSAVAGLRSTTAANRRAVVALDREVTAVVKSIQPAVDSLFGIANTLGAAALPLEQQLDELPSLIAQIGFGNVGAFVEELNGLDQLAEKLGTAASESAELNKAIDVKFAAGEGFPYGNAAGPNTSTMAVYQYKLAGASAPGASTPAIAGFAIIVLLIGGGLGVWLGRRRQFN